MDKVIRLLLQIALVLSSFAAFLASIRIFLGFALGTNWFWGGPIAAYFGPASFALALYFYERRTYRREMEAAE